MQDGSHTGDQPAWLQVAMMLVGAAALALLILQVLAGGQHGLVSAGRGFQQADLVVSQPAKPQPAVTGEI